MPLVACHSTFLVQCRLRIDFLYARSGIRTAREQECGLVSTKGFTNRELKSRNGKATNPCLQVVRSTICREDVMSSQVIRKVSIGTLAVALVLSASVPGIGQVNRQRNDSLFDFTSDVRVFTAYAMLNAAGGTGEWRRAGMHPIRSELRADLAGKLTPAFQRKLRNFNRSHGSILETYELALLTDGPPDFRLSYDPKKTGSLAKSIQTDSALPRLLAQFYRKAGIARLWEKYRPLIQAENDKYRAFGDSAVADVEAYCLLDSDYFSMSSRRIHFQYMPLLPYFVSLTARVDGDIYMIVGPQEDKPDRSVFYYHLLTRVTMPLVRSDSVEVGRLLRLYDLVKSKIDMRHGNWNTLVAECFAEAIDIRMEEGLYDLDSSAVQSTLSSEYKFGFILCPAIYEGLHQYELSGESFARYFPFILQNIDLQEEQQRWNEFWGEE